MKSKMYAKLGKRKSVAYRTPSVFRNQKTPTERSKLRYTKRKLWRANG